MSKAIKLVFFCLMVAFILFLTAPAFAGGTDIEQNTNIDSVLTGGDNISENSIGGSRSYGVGMGSIDVDIAQCLGSESTGIIIVQWQRLKENPWCMADTLDARGLHEAAARARCSVKAYLTLFESKDECLSLSKAEPQVFHVEPPEVSKDDEDYHEEEIEGLYARLSALEANRMAEAEKAQKAANRANAAAQRASEAELERKEYAQQALMELDEWK